MTTLSTQAMAVARTVETLKALKIEQQWLPYLEAAAETLFHLAMEQQQTPAGRPNAPPPV